MIEAYLMPGSGPSRAVHMMLKELGLDFKVVTVEDLYSKPEKMEEFKKGNPEMLYPTINDSGFFLWESRAILKYLAVKYSSPKSFHLYPKEVEKQATIDRLLDFDLGTFYHSLVEYFQPQIVEGLEPNEKRRKELEKSLDKLNNYLQDKVYVDGGDQMTIADLSLFASVTDLQPVEFDISQYSNVQRWVGKLKNQLPYNSEVNEGPLEIFHGFIKDRLKK